MSADQPREGRIPDGSSFLPGGFRFSDVPTEEIDRLEAELVPLADSVRALVDATIRSTVDLDEIRRARAEVDAVTARLRAAQMEGPAGVHFNAEGKAWHWGNAAVGARNAVAPPMPVRRDPDGVTRADVELGAAYEGPPGKVHGGVTALLLDHLMGVTASDGSRPTMTGTLTIRYERATPLGTVHLEGRIRGEEGVKVFVEALVLDDEARVCVRAEGVFVVPRWARQFAGLPEESGD
ncbi:PaaI family thioesterase [Spongisporangium articulatum]|uniref:Acyl-coenzyme A thioesterase THEM4 n=1 Tax=Spongisporangium articulatum TaxID=3362603 RepID=A0ABW8ATL6_9ACTN